MDDFSHYPHLIIGDLIMRSPLNRRSKLHPKFDIFGIWAAAILVDDMREESDLGGEELALVQVEDHSSFLEGTKDGLDMSFMFFCCLAEN